MTIKIYLAQENKDETIEGSEQECFDSIMKRFSWLGKYSPTNIYTAVAKLASFQNYFAEIHQ